MKLMTENLKTALPALYKQERLGEKAVAYIKFFCPWNYWSWFATEGEETKDGDYHFFGLVFGHEVELGYFTLSELESIKGPMGLGIERDLYFKPMTLNEVRQMMKERMGKQ